MSSRNHVRSWLAVLLTIGVAGCATSRLVTLPRTCGSGQHSAVCLTGTNIPESRSAEFSRAAQQAVDIAFSDQLSSQFREYITRFVQSGRFAGPDWSGVTADSALTRLRRVLGGLEVTTYGGLNGWRLWYFSKNRAFDGDSAGPVRINRIPPADANDLSNSILHEAAHRAGMTHDTGDRNCGPPYIIGGIAEGIARGTAPVGYCGSLEEVRAERSRQDSIARKR